MGRQSTRKTKPSRKPRRKPRTLTERRNRFERNSNYGRRASARMSMRSM
jgi:hypothetical protein